MSLVIVSTAFTLVAALAIHLLRTGYKLRH